MLKVKDNETKREKLTDYIQVPIQTIYLSVRCNNKFYIIF